MSANSLHGRAELTMVFYSVDMPRYEGSLYSQYKDSGHLLGVIHLILNRYLKSSSLTVSLLYLLEFLSSTPIYAVHCCRAPFLLLTSPFVHMCFGNNYRCQSVTIFLMKLKPEGIQFEFWTGENLISYKHDRYLSFLKCFSLTTEIKQGNESGYK